MSVTGDRVLAEYRIRRKIPRPDPEMYEAYWAFPTAAISDAFRKRQTLPANIQSIYEPAPKVVGPAITVHASPGDEILPVKAIELAKPGDVILVSGAESPRYSLWGGILSLLAKTRGVAALVTDALVRDVGDIEELGFPVYATGHTPKAPVMDIPPGELNLTIAFGDVLVDPGDLVVADRDGVVIVPKEKIAEVADAVRYRLDKEAKWEREIRENGTLILKDSIDGALAKRVVQYVDDGDGA